LHHGLGRARTKMKQWISKLLVFALFIGTVIGAAWPGTAWAAFEVDEGDIVLDNSESEYVTAHPAADWNRVTTNPNNDAYVPPGASVRYLQSYLGRDKGAYVDFIPRGDKAL